MKEWQTTAAVLVCAGSGSRMHGECADKLLLEVSGAPVAAHTLRAYDRAACIERLVVVTRPETVAVYQSFKERFNIQKELTVVTGGGSRMESVLRGVRAVPESCGFVAIGDGARPLIRPDEIDSTVRAAWEQGAAALGCCITDTVKKVRNGQIVRTIQRAELAAIQTPQVFPREEYLICAAAAAALHEEFTDDASIFERFGKKVALVEGRRDNLKITYPEDIQVLRALMEDVT